MTASSLYSTRNAELPAERDLALAVWEGTLGERGRMAAKFDWFYGQSPMGRPLALMLEWRSGPDAAAQVIGIASAGRRAFRKGGRLLAAGVLVDMAVRPEHRTLGPALQLQKGLLAEGLRSGDFLYGFPNPKAAPVFQRAGYRRLGMARRHVRVLRASGYLERRLPVALARLLAPFADIALRIRVELKAWGSRATELSWGAVDSISISSESRDGAMGEVVSGVRTREFLAWRFGMSGAGTEHRAVQGTLGEANVYWIVEDQGKVLQVRDCSLALVEPEGRDAWQALFRDAVRRGFHSVSFECLASVRREAMLESLGMVVRSERPVFWSGFGPGHPQDEAIEFFLTSADEDE